MGVAAFGDLTTEHAIEFAKNDRSYVQRETATPGHNRRVRGLGGGSSSHYSSITPVDGRFRIRTAATLKIDRNAWVCSFPGP